MTNPERNSGKFDFFGAAAEILAWFLTAVLPVKFASIVSVPEMPASYWFDIWSIRLTAWPVHLLSFCSSLLIFSIL